ncbi:tetratricopeptide repeat protein [Sphingobacterium hungaricum]|uniref:Tetratricopeptide repeat-containing protein n=1 Tax=Sphingobacterium hungaricum TaxID=2082723 RepID=A0A928YSI9_9SPHI|nr:tetratricopeptide repeat protein [Sphingobacterium hungaricum]MBE8714283.1 hypothetical protein [Sphingobacterium hungaricum]
MKYIHSFLFVLFIAASTNSFAQVANLRKAKTNLETFQKFSEAGTAELGKSGLTAAKEAIDEAIVHEKTSANPEVWTYYSIIYANLANLEKSEDYEQKAVAGIAKATELDTDKKNADNIKVAGQILLANSYNKGKEAWDKQDFVSAYKAFDGALAYAPTDTTLIYYSGIAAIQNKDYENAIKKYTQILDYPDYPEYKSVVVDLPKLYLSAQDTANALVFAAKAVELLPDNNDAAIQNIELNLSAGNASKIISQIEAQIAKDPTNKFLQYYLGVAYNADNKEVEALAAFKKAVEIDPNFLEANVNAAVNIMNATRDKLFNLNEDKTLSTNDYNKKVDEIRKEILAAEPYLLKSAELEPTEVEHLKRLKNFYDFTQNEAKSVEIQAKIDAF